MADFHQNGNIATLHNLRTRSQAEMTYELETFAQTRKMTLILPCLYRAGNRSDAPAFLDELSKVTYLHRIIIGLDRADEAQFRHAKEFFKGLNQNHIVIWNDSPRMQALEASATRNGARPRREGQRQKRLVLSWVSDRLPGQRRDGDPRLRHCHLYQRPCWHA